MRRWLLRSQEEEFLSVPYKLPGRHRGSRRSTGNGEIADPAVQNMLSQRRSIGEKIMKLETSEELATFCRGYLRALVAHAAVSGGRVDLAFDPFTPLWSNAFRPREVVAAKPALHAEVAATCFHVGALNCRAAALADTATPDGLNQAVNGFESAAAAFVFVQNEVSCLLQGGSVDLSGDCTGMLSKLMLAQAQECYWKKAMGDRRSPVICSNIAMQVSRFYEEARSAATSAPLSQLVGKRWRRHLEAKVGLFRANAMYQLSLDHRQKELWGEEIARLKEAVLELAQARQRSVGIVAGRLSSGPVMASLATLEEEVRRRLAEAEKQNADLYFVRIPKPEALPPVASTAVVRILSPGIVLCPEVYALFNPQEARGKDPASTEQQAQGGTDEAVISELRAWSNASAHAATETAEPRTWHAFGLRVAGLRLNKIKFRGRQQHATGERS